MGRCKLRHIICDVLSERCIIHDQLSFFIKIQPVLDRISIQGFRFISKSIRNACFCEIVTCIKRRLQIRIVAGDICFYIHIRLTVEINRSFISRNSFRKHVISIFQIQLTSLCLRNNLKLRISICDICILRSYLILFLCTVKCLHLFFQLFFIVSRVLSGCIALLFKKTSDPFIRFLIFQKFQNTSIRNITIADLISADRLRIQISGINLYGIVLYCLRNLLFCLISSFTRTVNTIDRCSFKEFIRIII